MSFSFCLASARAFSDLIRSINRGEGFPFRLPLDPMDLFDEFLDGVGRLGLGLSVCVVCISPEVAMYTGGEVLFVLCSLTCLINADVNPILLSKRKCLVYGWLGKVCCYGTRCVLLFVVVVVQNRKCVVKLAPSSSFNFPFRFRGGIGSKNLNFHLLNSQAQSIDGTILHKILH